MAYVKRERHYAGTGLTRDGEGLTVRDAPGACRTCGGRLEEVIDAYTQEVRAVRCKGCGKRQPRGEHE